MSEASQTTEKTYQIYAPGYPEEGAGMTEGQLQAALSSGRLRSCDLVWCDGAWRQLSDVFELPPYELPPCEDGGEQDIAVSLSQLAASSLRPVMQEASGRRGLLGGLLRRLAWKDGRRRPVWQLALGGAGGVALLLLLLAAGYVYGLVPLVNRVFWRPAYALIVNPYRTECTVTFMEKEYTLPGHGTLTIPDLFGRMPRVETMILTTPWDKSQKKIHVELRAGETVLVNPMGMCFFGVLKKGGLSSVGAPDLEAVRSDVTANREPVSAFRLGEQARKIGKGLLLASTDASNIHSSDEIASVHGLDFGQLGLTRSEAYLAREGSGGPSADGSRISSNLLHGVEIENGVKVRYRKGSGDVAECTIELEFPAGERAFSPVKAFGKEIPVEFFEFEPVSGKARCRVKFEEAQNQVVIEFSRRNFRVRRHQRDILGSWSYEAVQNPADGRWSWRWRFSGQDAPKIASLSMTLNQNGKLEAIKYGERR